MPTSKLKSEIARILKEEGYIRDFRVEEARHALQTLIVELKYGRSRERVLSGIKRISKPGRRIYAEQGSPAARARRHGHRNPVHLTRRDHEPHRRDAKASAAK